jgi:hypothetical protein
MGSGISLCEVQLVSIIKRDIVQDFYEKEMLLPLYTDEGYEIFRDFSNEAKMNNKIREVYWYIHNYPKYIKK